MDHETTSETLVFTDPVLSKGDREELIKRAVRPLGTDCREAIEWWLLNEGPDADITADKALGHIDACKACQRCADAYMSGGEFAVQPVSLN